MKTVTIVSGLPRSGTSMMMKMLEAGGIRVLTDGERTADSDNPRGYFEFERAKKLRNGNVEWLSEAQGKAVKVISELLKWLAPEYQYRIIFMRRNMEEVLASQKKMLENRGTDSPAGPDDETLAALFERHLEETRAWLARQPNMETLYIDYSEVLSHPEVRIADLNTFLGGSLDTAAMAAAIDPKLHRQRRS